MNQPVRRRVVTERRRRPLLIGLWLSVGGLVLTVVAALLLSGNQAIQVAAADDRASVPDPLQFEAQDGTYVILLLPTTIGIPALPNPIAELTCDVELADGEEAVVDGSRQASSLETSVGETVGTFDAVAGPTTVICDFRGSPDTSGYFVAVAEQRSALNLIGIVGLVAGILAMCIGAGLIFIGVRGRTVIQPIKPGQM